MNYPQWMAATIIPKGNITISIRNAKLAWGKFYKKETQDSDADKETYTEMPVEEVNQLVVATGSNITIYACGMSDTASGTEGRFDIYEGDTPIGNFYWDCLWGKITNAYKWTPHEAGHDFVTQVTGFNLHAGPLGSGTLICAKIS